MNVAVIGTGYVGLVVGAGLADFGLNVTSVDIDAEKIAALQSGHVPIYEPGLAELIRKNVGAGRLRYSADLESAVARSLVLFLTVGTESEASGRADLRALERAVRAIAGVINEYRVLVIKSTVPVGTAAWLKREMASWQKAPVPCDIVSNPEFLREGSAIENFMRPDRVVLGSTSEPALAIVRDIYRPLYLIETPFVTTDHETAELIKYAANAFLALKISFINEVANLCDAVGADVHVVARAMGLDKRIGAKFLHPSPGFGGPCLPKDAQALVRIAEFHESPMSLVVALLEVNQRQSGRVVHKLEAMLGGLREKAVAILGLAYKPNTDDVRDSPAIRVCKALLKAGARLQAHDPAAMERAREVLGQESVSFHPDPYDAAGGADALVVLTEWNDFRNLDLQRVRTAMRGDVLVDARNVYDPAAARALGFRYAGMGRGAPPAGRGESMPAIVSASS